jgi:hypothetical protein
MATTEGNLEQFSYESYERVSYFAPCNGAHMATCPKTTSYGNEVFRSGCAPHPYMPPVGKKTPTGRNYFLVPYVFHLKTREFEN